MAEVEHDGGEAWARTLWKAYLTGDHEGLGRKVGLTRSVFRHLPAKHRCRVCQAPLDGLSSRFTSLIGFGTGPSGLNPTLCDRCERIVKGHGVGVELEITMLFADVRGSTALAEKIGPSAFHQLIDRFYRVGVGLFIESGALIEKLIGDEIAALYVPGIAGPDHPARAVQAAVDLLAATGHAPGQKPWLPIGAGVHTGLVYAGSVGGAGRMSVITVLGDAANTTARLASSALPGEILISEETYGRVGASMAASEPHVLEVRGREQTLTVRSLRPSLV